MQRVVQRTGSVLTLALLAAVGVSLGAFAADDAPDKIRLELDGSSLVRMEGLVDLRCGVEHAASTSGIAAPGRLSGTAGFLRTIVVTENRTTTPQGIPDLDDLSVHVAVDDRALEGSDLELFPGDDPRLWVHPGTAPFTDAAPVAMHATAARLTGDGAETGRATPRYHWSGSDAGDATWSGIPVQEKIEAPVRPTTLDEANASFVGKMRVRLQDLAIREADGTTIPAVPHRTTTVTPLGPLGSRETTRIVDRWLVLDAGRLDVVARQMQVDCGKSEGALIGQATWLRADGTVRSGANDLTFADRAVTLDGVLGFTETPHADPGRPLVESAAEGDAGTTVLGVDFRIMTGPAVSDEAKATFFAVIVAALVWAIVEWFPRGALLGYSRIETDRVLDHPQRAALADFIRNNPGTSLLNAAERLDSNRSALRHHLARLIDHGIVRRIRVDRRPVLVPGEWETDQARRAILAEKPTVAYILERCGEEGLPRPDLAREVRHRFSISDTAARKWIAKCHEQGLIETLQKDGEVIYCRA